MKTKITILVLFIYSIISAQFPKINLDTLDLSSIKNKYILDKKVEETSGLQLLNGNKIYTFNDSGGKNEIYQMDLKGNITSTIKIENSVNKDWEDITTDGKNIFIADTGNNLGNRRDLKLYKIDLNDIHKNISKRKKKKKKKDLVDATELNFEYEKQTEFPEKSNLTTDFDCEAIVYFNGKIHLFSKEWTSFKTRHYILDPKEKNKQSLSDIETFNVEMLVTGAEIIDNTLYLVGYTRNGIVSLYQFEKDENSDLFFKNKFKKTFLGISPAVGQIEAITGDKNGLYISGEDFKLGIFHTPQTMYYIPFK